jgi:hypothetical protein
LHYGEGETLTYARISEKVNSMKLILRGTYEEGLSFLDREKCPRAPMIEPFITMHSWKDKNFRPHTDYSSFTKTNFKSYLNKSYYKDRLIVGFSENCDEVEIFGDPEAKNKILLDLVVSDSSVSPIHGCVLAKNGKAVVVVSDSKMGKSSLVIRGMESGYDFLSDELVLCDGSFVYCCLTPIYIDSKNLHLRHRLKDDIQDPIALAKRFKVSTPSKAAVQACIVLINKEWKGLSSLTRPYPSVVSNSYWGTYAMYPDWKNRLELIRKTTHIFWNQFLASSIVLDHFDIRHPSMRKRFMKVLRETL